MITIIDYDAGNIKSVEKALQFLNADVKISRDRETILNSDKVILPGVGAFGDAMDKLNRYGLTDVIRDFTQTGKPFLGICLGLQLLFESSEESPGVKGLGILKGKVQRIPKSYTADDGQVIHQKVPQIGWNNLDINPSSRLFKGIEGSPYVYFVHSYYLTAENDEDVAARTFYGTEIHAAVEKDNIFATQFHPEKSSNVGLLLLSNFVYM